MITISHVLGTNKVTWDKGEYVFTAKDYLAYVTNGPDGPDGNIVHEVFEELFASENRGMCAISERTNTVTMQSLTTVQEWLQEELHLAVHVDLIHVTLAPDLPPATVQLSDYADGLVESLQIKMLKLKVLQDIMLVELRVIQDTKSDRILHDTPF